MLCWAVSLQRSLNLSAVNRSISSRLERHPGINSRLSVWCAQGYMHAYMDKHLHKQLFGIRWTHWQRCCSYNIQKADKQGKLIVLTSQWMQGALKNSQRVVWEAELERNVSISMWEKHGRPTEWQKDVSEHDAERYHARSTATETGCDGCIYHPDLIPSGFLSFLPSLQTGCWCCDRETFWLLSLSPSV